MYLLFVLTVWTIFGIKFVHWKNLKEYYSTILFYIAMNLLVDFVYYNHTLFAFKAVTTKFLNHTLISMGFIFFIMPIVILIFLQRLPETIIDQIKYLLVWSLFFWIIEYIFLVKGLYIHDNGWNIWHSGWFNTMMFSLLILHYKSPKITLIISPIAILLFIVAFPVPLSSLK